MAARQGTAREARVKLARERAAQMYEEIARFHIGQGDLERARHFIRRARRHMPRLVEPREPHDREPAVDGTDGPAMRYVIEDDRGISIGEFDSRGQAECALRALLLTGACFAEGLLLWALDANGKSRGLPRDIFDLE